MHFSKSCSKAGTEVDLGGKGRKLSKNRGDTTGA